MIHFLCIIKVPNFETQELNYSPHISVRHSLAKLFNTSHSNQCDHCIQSRGHGAKPCPLVVKVILLQHHAFVLS